MERSITGLGTTAQGNGFRNRAGTGLEVCSVARREPCPGVKDAWMSWSEGWTEAFGTRRGMTVGLTGAPQHKIGYCSNNH